MQTPNMNLERKKHLIYKQPKELGHGYTKVVLEPCKIKSGKKVQPDDRTLSNFTEKCTVYPKGIWSRSANNRARKY